MEKVVTLCGVQGCCPTVRFCEDGTFEIRDDFGGSVKLSKEQMEELQKLNIFDQNNTPMQGK